MARKKSSRGHKRGVSGRFTSRSKIKKHKGHVPLKVLENRLETLNTVVKKRGGDYLD